jgi:hypothetical protein
MLRRLNQRNEAIWEGHPRVLEDLTHVIGGIGLGLLLYPIVRQRTKLIGYSMLLMSTALHFYADTVKPPRRPMRLLAKGPASRRRLAGYVLKL